MLGMRQALFKAAVPLGVWMRGSPRGVRATGSEQE